MHNPRKIVRCPVVFGNLQVFVSEPNQRTPQPSHLTLAECGCLHQYHVVLSGYQFTAPMSLRTGLTSRNMTTAAANAIPATQPNSVGSGIELKKPAANPASLFPTALARNHTPIIKPTIRIGASLVTTLRPTGLKHISPTTCKKYDVASHNAPTRIPWACAIIPAGTITINARPTKKSPNANFAGLEGLRGPRLNQSQAKTGARIKTRIAGTDWNHDAGNAVPKTVS